jgi:xanthine dehydrogenase accessory factor
MAWIELRQIIEEYRESDGPFALATIVKSSGSTYRHAGARMLITPDKHSFGRLSAGCIEEEVADRAQRVIRTGQPFVWSIDLRSRFACDGSIQVLVERLTKPNPFLEALMRMLGDREPFLVATNYRLTDSEPGTGLTDKRENDHEEEFLEEILPPVRLIVFGEHADAEAVLHLSKFLGWQVELAFDADTLPVGDARTACVVMSHHFGRDIVALRKVLQGSFGYVGLLGPRQRKNLLLNELISEGFPLENISALHSPAGLDIGSESPEEIALAVVAEIQATLTRRKGGHLRDRVEPIHKVRKRQICNELR